MPKYAITLLGLVSNTESLEFKVKQSLFLSLCVPVSSPERGQEELEKNLKSTVYHKPALKSSQTNIRRENISENLYIIKTVATY